ncbi:MAG TPA: MOSC N-terminal beta barrel domain-containing protein [Kofleriaceae bacterium]
MRRKSDLLAVALPIESAPPHRKGMQVTQLWRYPVKSMAGEPLDRAAITNAGIPGDRVVLVRHGARIVTSRSRPRLLLHHATLGEDGEPRVDGLPWQSPEVARRVRDATALDAELVRDDTLERFDVLPLLVITDGALAAFGRDPRRLRPNLVIGGVAGLAERTWPGRVLAIGSVRIRLVTRRRRCIMTTFDPETAAQDPQVLLDIHQRFSGELALDAEVLVPGSIAVGDRACLE